jgi:hypothetical protein
MDEEISREPYKFNLDATIIEWSTVHPKEEDKGRWSFTVDGKETGRKLAYEYTLALDNPTRARFIKPHLEDPTPIEDERLDGGQISFSEYDANDENNGNIVLVEFVLRNYADDTEYYAKYMNAMKALLDNTQKPQ